VSSISDCQDEKFRAINALYSSADDDFYRRLETLSVEIRHVKRVANFYCEKRQNSRFSDNEGGAIVEIRTLADKLLKAIIKEINDFGIYLIEVSAKMNHFSSLENKLKVNRERLIFHAYFRERAKRLSRQLGYLNHRLGQQLERHVLEDPAPTLRRALEQGFTSEFLRTLTKNAYRDMNLFLKNHLGCSLPYTEIPQTIQYWTYSESYYGDMYRNKEARKYADRMNDREDDIFEEKRKKNGEAFNSILMSFWNIDFPELYSILAHELAHILIQDISSNLNLLVIGNGKRVGTFGKLARKISIIFDGWLVDDQVRASRPEIEVVADLLAAAKFGPAYIYSWFIEMLNSAADTRPLKDEYSNFASIIKTFEEKKIKFNILEYVEPVTPTGFDMVSYVRGRAIYTLIENSFPNKDDSEKMLLKAFSYHLENILENRVGHDQHREQRLLWKTIGDQISRAVKKSGICTKLAEYHELSPSMHPIDTAKQNWHPDEQWFLHEQLISESIQNELKDKGIVEYSSDIKRYYPLDITWRLIFNDYKSDCKKNNYGDPSYLLCQKNAINRKPYIHTIQSDYIYKSGNISYIPIIRKLGETFSDQAVTQRDKLYNVDGIPSQSAGVKDIRVKYSDIYKKNRGAAIEWQWDSNCLTNEFAYLDLILAATPKDIYQLKEMYDDAHCSTTVTYGRYDRLSISWDHDCPLTLPNKHGEWDEIEKNISSKIRRRAIRKLSSSGIGIENYVSPGNADRNKSPDVVVLISLVDKGLRNHFIRYEMQYLFRTLKISLKELACQMFSSEGYEDFVLTFYRNGHSNINLCGLYKFVRYIYDSPFVSRTETIVSEVSFAGRPYSQHDQWLSGLTVSIGARVKPDVNGKFLSWLKKDFKNSFRNVVVSFQPGRTDYTFSFSAPLGPGNISTFHKVRETLINEENLFARITTNLSETI
jgi:hypothetical protein